MYSAGSIRAGQSLCWAPRVLHFQSATSSTGYNGSMASSLDRNKLGKNLLCFYCGRRSSLKQDGSVSEWACTYCEAVNYLDENGEITEPPIATTSQAPTIQYAQALPRPTSPSSNPDSALFCDDCLKNQHLFMSSLAQYNPNDELKLYDRKYYEFRQNLERRYPQVCSDCEAGVLQRIKQAGYTAKTDHLRRLMDKTRSTRSATRRKLSWAEFFQFWGGVIWWFGLAGQVIWNIVGLLETVHPRISAHCSPEISSFDCDKPTKSQVVQNSLACLVRIGCWVHSRYRHYFNKLVVPTSTLSKWSLILSVISIWWNPKYRHMVRGFDSQIKGFSDWYKYQAILIMTRVLFQYLMGTNVFSDVEAPATLGVHIFMLFFVGIVAISAQKSIKIDITPLFAPTPEKLRPYVQRKEKSDKADMDVALNDIAAEQFKSGSQNYELDLEPRRTFPSGTQRNYNFLNNSQLRHRGGITLPGMDNAPSLANLTEVEASEYLRTGALPESERMRTQHQEMDWDPAPSKVLNISRSPQVPLHFRSHPSPPTVPQPSAFWYPVPPAPVSPAHMLRNPPNQPRLQPRTAEAKQNFFDEMMRPTYGERLQNDSVLDRSRRQEVNFTQPKFFPPPSAADNVLNGLSEIFGNVKLKTESEVGAAPNVRNTIETATSRRLQHVGTAVVLVSVLLGWNYASAHSSTYLWNIELAVMTICGAIALRSITDYTMGDESKTNTPMTNALGATLSGVEAAVAGYGILDVLARPQDRDISQGAILICVMLVHEVWNVAF